MIITWKDSLGSSPTWEHLPEKPVQTHICVSVGFLIQDNQDNVLLVPHLSPENKEIGVKDTGCGDMTIPKAAIIKQIQLHSGDPTERSLSEILKEVMAVDPKSLTEPMTI